MAMMSAAARLVRQLTPTERDQMFALFESYYNHAARAQFEKDLSEKDWVILLTDSAGSVHGFSTLGIVHASVDAIPVFGLFSGDTALRREHWGEQMWHRAWLQHFFHLSQQIGDKHPAAKVYWLLLSAGYRTYTLLPHLFREFWPNHAKAMSPLEQKIRDALAQRKFPTEYSARKGLAYLAAPTPVRSGVAEVPERLRLDPHIRFFSHLNPGHGCGDQLVCLAELRYENLTPLGRRLLGQRLLSSAAQQ